MKNNFYKIGFFILLALILMGASTVSNFTNVTPVAPKTIMTYRGRYSWIREVDSRVS